MDHFSCVRFRELLQRSEAICGHLFLQVAARTLCPVTTPRDHNWWFSNKNHGMSSEGMRARYINDG
jgi:hypothetical protein